MIAPLMLGHYKEHSCSFLLAINFFSRRYHVTSTDVSDNGNFSMNHFPPLHSSHLLFQQSSKFSLQTKDDGKS